MKRLAGFIILVLAVALPAIAFDIHIDYDRWARMTTFKTIAWMPTEETSVLDSSALMHDRIKSVIMAHVLSGRLTEDNEDPDLYITYHTDEKEALRVDTHYWGYGYPSSWYWDPYWGGGQTTTSVCTFMQGTLVVDIWDAREKTLVWRGTAVGLVQKNPESNAKQVEKALKKMTKKWDKMKPGF